MKRVEWKDRQPGDIGLVYAGTWIAKTIVDFERRLHPQFTGAFVPDHAFVVAYADHIIEAEMRVGQNCETAVNVATEYASVDPANIRLYRLDRNPTQIGYALWMLQVSGMYKHYGIDNLLGFALEAFEHALGDSRATNPIKRGLVCSQIAAEFLAYPSGEQWTAKPIDIRDCDPLALFMLLEAHCDV